MTVPALGCPGISRWDLTRHGLSSLPYSPDTGGRVGKGAMRGEEIIGCGFSLFHPNIKTTVECPLSKTKPILFYSTAQEIVSHSYFHSKLCWRVVVLNIFLFLLKFLLGVTSHQQHDGVLRQFMG